MTKSQGYSNLSTSTKQIGSSREAKSAHDSAKQSPFSVFKAQRDMFLTGSIEKALEGSEITSNDKVTISSKIDSNVNSSRAIDLEEQSFDIPLVGEDGQSSKHLLCMKQGD